ncbi:MAG: hypothetical protein ACRD59_03295 [Candidatus Acidiferrales bacterium]
MSKTTRLSLVKPTHGINEVEGETLGVPNEAVNLDAIDAAIAAPYGLADYTADGAIAQKEGTVTISKVTAAAMTLADPTSGADDGKQLTIICGTAHAHVITVATTLKSGTNNTITLTGAVGDLVVLKAVGGKWCLMPSVNATASHV